MATDFTFTPLGGLILTVTVRRLTHFLAGGIETSCSAVTEVLGSAAGPGVTGGAVTGGGVTGGAVGVGSGAAGVGLRRRGRTRRAR